MSSPVAGVSPEDSDSDSMDYGSQLIESSDEGTPKWAAYLSEEDDVDFGPKIPILERIRMKEERENELIRKARARGMAKVPDDYVPPPPVKPESMEVKMARYKAWCEKLARIQREKEELMEKNRKLARAEYERHAKLQKEYRTRSYYWKPNPLFALHMKELGYSKIATDKALFYTDNVSVARAVEYLKKNPNPTELTKEEVMAAGEEVLKRIRPVKPHKHDHSEQTLLKEGEMEIEQEGQPFLADDDRLTCIRVDNNFDGGKKDLEEVPREKPVNINDGMTEDKIKRGIKRNYGGEEVKSFPTMSSLAGLLLPPAKKIIPEYKMIFMVNVSLLMDAITLSLEVGKVVANLAKKMRDDTGEIKKIFDEWIKEGNKMSMYKGNDSEHLKGTYKGVAESGVLTYLGQCSHYREVKTPSPTVLGIFGDMKKLKGLPDNLELM